jgi:hypothetical protein
MTIIGLSGRVSRIPFTIHLLFCGLSSVLIPSPYLGKPFRYASVYLIVDNKIIVGGP